MSRTNPSGTTADQNENTKSSDEDYDYQIEDVESYVQRRRLEELMDARAQFREQKSKAKELRTTHEDFTDDDVSSLIIESLRDYIRELRPIAMRHPRGDLYWEEKSIGNFQLNPPVTGFLAWRHYKQNNGRRDVDLNEMPPGYRHIGDDMSPRNVEFEGLVSILETETPIIMKWSVTYYIRNEGYQTVTDTTAHTIPLHIINRFYDVAGELAAEVGLEVGIGEQDIDADPY